MFVRISETVLTSRIEIDGFMESPYEIVGRVTHFYPKVGVAIIELSSTLGRGERIIVRGSTTRIEQAVDSMEFNHAKISSAQPGQMVGIKLTGRVRENDVVYRVKLNGKGI